MINGSTTSDMDDYDYFLDALISKINSARNVVPGRFQLRFSMKIFSVASPYYMGHIVYLYSLYIKWELAIRNHKLFHGSLLMTIFSLDIW